MDTKLTNQSIGSISDRLWDFVEANVPNYHERDDVMRQAELQLFIDGHESPVQGITREHALAERDGILLRLYHEAIEAFTRRSTDDEELEKRLDTIFNNEELRERFAEFLLSEAMTDTEPYHKVARGVIDAYMERNCDALLMSICGWLFASLAEKVLTGK